MGGEEPPWRGAQHSHVATALVHMAQATQALGPRVSAAPQWATLAVPTTP